MTPQRTLALAAAVGLVGCAAAPLHVGESLDPIPSTDSPVPVSQAAYEELAHPEQLQPVLVEDPSLDDLVEPSSMARPQGSSIEGAVAAALANNPAVQQAEARLRALRGKWVQVGLPLNPIVGYTASEIGSRGSAGQQGAYVGQTFITAGKRQKSRDVTSAEIGRAEQSLAATIQRVRTDVRQRYYEVLMAQRRIKLSNGLVRLTTEAAEASESLVEAEELAMAGMLQTEIQRRNATVLATTSTNELDCAWRQLENLVGPDVFARQPIVGELELLPQRQPFEAELERVRSLSPEVATAIADVERARRGLTLAHAQARPNLSTQVTLQKDDGSGDTLTGVQIGGPLPVWNRNQGGVRQAEADVTEAMRNVKRVEQDLERRLADAYRRYANSRATVEAYSAEILPKSQETLELVQQGYQHGEVGYLVYRVVNP